MFNCWPFTFRQLRNQIDFVNFLFWIDGEFSSAIIQIAMTLLSHDVFSLAELYEYYCRWNQPSISNKYYCNSMYFAWMCGGLCVRECNPVLKSLYFTYIYTISGIIVSECVKQNALSFCWMDFNLAMPFQESDGWWDCLQNCRTTNFQCYSTHFDCWFNHQTEQNEIQQRKNQKPG